MPRSDASASEFHEAANIFPLDDEHLDELAKDIKQHGQLESIRMFDGKILDGRRRFMACRMAGITPTTEDVSPDDPIAYVLSMNLHRRHLDSSQRAMIGARARGAYEKAAKERQRAGGGDKKSGVKTVTHPIPNQGKSRDHVGAAVGVSGPSIDRAKKVLAKGVPELIAAVDSGAMTASTAAEVAERSPEEQKQILEAEDPRKKLKEIAAPPGASGQNNGRRRPQTISERALAARAAIADGVSMKDATLKYVLGTTNNYKRAAQVATSGKAELIKAMDDELLTISGAVALVRSSDEKIAKAIDAARLKLSQEKYKPQAAAGRPVQDVLLELLDRTWTEWKGLGQNLRLNSKAIPPPDSKKFADMRRLVVSVRRAVNEFLDRIERELEQCNSSRRGTTAPSAS